MNILTTTNNKFETMIDNKAYLSWSGFEFCIDAFIEDYKNNNYKCDLIYGPPRGGLPIAVTLSHRLGVPLTTTYPTTGSVVLVVDDIADTGKTLKPLIGPNIITYTLYYHKQSIVEPNYWVFEKEDKWIVFPWEENVYVD
jgi:hypoxanthine phosphoribosyltransferase